MVKWIFPFLFFVVSDKHLCLVFLLAGVGGARTWKSSFHMMQKCGLDGPKRLVVTWFQHSIIALFQTGLSCKPLSWLKFADCRGFGQHNDVVWPNQFVNWL